MQNSDVLKKLGWAQDLIGEFEKAAKDIQEGLPEFPESEEQARSPMAASGTEFDLSPDPVATQSLFYICPSKGR